MGTTGSGRRGDASSTQVAVLGEPGVVAAALTPLRRRLLALLDEPSSATRLGERLGLPRQRVNYHLRELERLGLVTLVEERQRRGVVERLVRRSSDAMLVDPAVLGTALPTRDRTAAEATIAAASDAIRAVGRAVAAAARRGERLATATVDVRVRFAGPADVRRFLDELGALCARYDAPGDGARTYQVTTLAYPATEGEERP